MYIHDGMRVRFYDEDETVSMPMFLFLSTSIQSISIQQGQIIVTALTQRKQAMMGNGDDLGFDDNDKQQNEVSETTMMDE